MVTENAAREAIRRNEARIAQLEAADREHADRMTRILVALEQIKGELKSQGAAVGVKFWAIVSAIGFGSTVAGGIAVGVAVAIVQYGLKGGS